MNYHDCLSYLERLGDEVLTMKFGLKTIRTLLAALDHPHQKYPCVIIAGTNGKGSAARFLNSICTACGVRNGLYTSPHLVGIEERFVVDEKEIDPDSFARCFSQVAEAIRELKLPQHPTYFETLTAVAFLYFYQQRIELGILEVGMGGRLDSTNVVDPVLSILTPVGLDHQQFLGATLEAIAREKAGVLHQGRPALTAPQKPSVRQVFLEEAEQRGAVLHELDCSSIDCLESQEGRYAFRFGGQDYRLGLLGRHQVQNAALAVQAAELLREAGFTLSSSGIRQGIESAQWPGRIQKIGDHPTVILDGAHNADAARNLAEFLAQHTSAPRNLLFGIMRDKDIAEVLSILAPGFSKVYLTQVAGRRAASVEELQVIFPSAIAVRDPLCAYQEASKGCATIVVAGSFYLVGEILPTISTASLR